MKYKLNLKNLLPGDIILVGYNDIDSREIQRRTNSKYSHVMLMGDGCLIHASDIVITENPSRQIFEEDEQVCVMRLDSESWYERRILDVIAYAKNLVGTLYDKEALNEMKEETDVHPNPNRQMCAKFVAQCYHEAGFVPIVEDYNLCTPEDLRQADDDFVVINDPIVKANEWDIEYANRKPDVTEEQFLSIKSFLLRMLVKYPTADIMNLNQLELFLENNPDKDEEVLKELQRTKYFDLWYNESVYCPFLYDAKKFMDFWKSDSLEKAKEIIRDSAKIIFDRTLMIQHYDKKIASVRSFEYFNAMRELQYNIMTKANERISVANEVLNFFGISEIKI